MAKLEKERWPPWLRPLLGTTFFPPCDLHNNSSKNMYCLDCTNGAMCSSCIVYGHRHHHVIQIRRSSYHDVIRVSEIQKLLDLSGVQTYVINGARVVFLNARPQLRLGKGVNKTCDNCGRSLLEAFTFCSLGCKVARAPEMATSGFGVTTLATQSTSDKDGSTKQCLVCPKHGITLDCCLSPPTPPPMSSTNRIAKRRKGIPKRAPLGVC